MTKHFAFILLHCFLQLNSTAQNTKGTDIIETDSAAIIQQMVLKQNEQHRIDSLIRLQLKAELLSATSDSKTKLELEERLNKLTKQDSLKKIAQLQEIELLKKSSKKYPVVLFSDTILKIYTRTGSFTPRARAEAISDRIQKLYEDDFFKPDSLKLNQNEGSIDVIYKTNIIMSVTEIDGLWLNTPPEQLGKNYLKSIKNAIVKYKKQNSFSNLMIRIGEILIIICCLGLIIFLINRLSRKVKTYLIANQDKFLNGITIRKFKIFTPEKHRQFIFRVNNVIRILLIILLIYLSLPLMFSVFPGTKIFTDTLINWVLSPAKRILHGIIDFLPNLFTIIVIYFITKYAIKAIHFFFHEIEKGNIVLKTFHKDWAIPTFNILKFILYAFMVVVIFPYLPGSDSAAFQGVSVFLGVLFSLGSSSAITNIIAGLVITYMRPFKIGDRVKIGDVVGDVVEKTMLVTRIRTIKNEDITVPNSTVLSSHTINYSTNVNDTGLIVHTTVTIGYDVSWKKMHQALIDAALRTDMILKEPLPFVLQTSLEDFYVSYQINAYTKEANKQAVIYSYLHANIQDCCNEAGIEILSPHYRAARDGNTTTIPENYLAKDYKAPSFNVNMKKEEQ